MNNSFVVFIDWCLTSLIFLWSSSTQILHCLMLRIWRLGIWTNWRLPSALIRVNEVLLNLVFHSPKYTVLKSGSLFFRPLMQLNPGWCNWTMTKAYQQDWFYSKTEYTFISNRRTLLTFLLWSDRTQNTHGYRVIKHKTKSSIGQTVCSFTKSIESLATH